MAESLLDSFHHDLRVLFDRDEHPTTWCCVHPLFNSVQFQKRFIQLKTQGQHTQIGSLLHGQTAFESPVAAEFLASGQ